MSSNSPVLILAPSAVSSAPMMSPLLVAKSADLRARGLIPTHAPLHTEKPTEATKAPVAAPTADVTLDAKRPDATATPAVMVPPVAQVANAAPIVVPRSTPTPTTPTPTTPTFPTPTPATLPTPTPASTMPAVTTPPTRPSVAPLARATPTTPLGTPSTLTKRAAAVAAAAAASATASPSALTVTTALSSPVSSPKASSSSPSSPKSGKSSTGRWTEAEHKLFLKGLEQFPYRAWKKIATLIKTRTVVQIRTHAQKYYQKLEKEEQRMREREAQLAAQQGASAASAPALSSVVTTPRSSVPSAPTTPSAAASASFRDLSLSAPLVTTPSAAAAGISIFSEASVGAAGKRKAPMRKRKSSTDDDLMSDLPPSSLPKRMMKEKRFVREKTMSPKQKTVVSSTRVFGFGGDGDSSSSDDGKGSCSMRGLSGLKTHPLDFDDDDDATTTSSSMILGFGEEKPMEYPFALDSALERSLAAIDHDELLQLSDDESMEWFATAAGDADDLLEGTDANAPLHLESTAFSPLYSEDALHFVDPAPALSVAAVASECSTPSPILTSSSADCSDFGLSSDEVDDDEDFVLDPEKFLSSYFNPDADHDVTL